MIHHLSFGTNDRDRARAFYDPVLATVGYRLMCAILTETSLKL